jgi:hypothetical protein
MSGEVPKGRDTMRWTILMFEACAFCVNRLNTYISL